MLALIRTDFVRSFVIGFLVAGVPMVALTGVAA